MTIYNLGLYYLMKIRHNADGHKLTFSENKAQVWAQADYILSYQTIETRG